MSPHNVPTVEILFVLTLAFYSDTIGKKPDVWVFILICVFDTIELRLQ